MILTWLSKYREFGLLLLRLGIGGMFAFSHGWPKIAGGVEKWRAIGGAMRHLGINFAPEFWGFMAATAEFGGGILLILGFFFRPACALLAFTMLVAAVTLTRAEGSIFAASHPIELGIVFLALILIGPGKYSIDRG